MIRVMIADDHAIVRRGLKQILSETDDIVVTGEAETAIDAIRMTRKDVCDVILLDISLPDKSGIEALKQIKKYQPRLAVLMLSMHAEHEFAVRSLKAGAAGYLNKQSAPALLVTAIRQVAAGKKYVSAAVAEELANALDENSGQAPHTTLSDREFQALRLIASGKTLAGISAELHLSPKTISVYRARLLEKLKLRNNSDLTRYAIKNQLVD